MSLIEQNFQQSSIFSNYAYLFFLFFTVTRPISLIDIGIPFILEFYAIAFCYIFLLLILISARKIIIDRTGILILVFIFFCGMSFAWGTEFREFTRVTLPFVFFFFTTTCISEKFKIDSFFNFYNIGFLIPLILSTIFIILGLNIQLVEYLSKVPRHSGIYSGAHVLAYQMSLFSFIFCYNYFLSDNRNKNFRLLSILMFFLSIYCLYQSYTRTAYIAFVLFWGMFLYGIKKKYFIVFLALFFILGLLFSSHISNIFIKKKGEADLSTATSGRTELWDKYFDAFLNSSIPEKILGKGIGWKLPGPGFHSDWLRILLQTGIVGVILFSSISVSIMYDIYLCPNVKIKYFFGSILISLIIIMVGSNNVISFFEISILFWILMGFFYNLKGFNKKVCKAE